MCLVAEIRSLRRERSSERVYRSEANAFEPLECLATFNVSNVNKWRFENNVPVKVIRSLEKITVKFVGNA